MLGGSLTRVSPAPVAAAEAQAWAWAGLDPNPKRSTLPRAPTLAQAWAWAGFNLLTLGAPTAAELRNYSGAAAALGAWLDGGYSFGYFVAAEPRSPAAEADGGAGAGVAGTKGGDSKDDSMCVLTGAEDGTVLLWDIGGAMASKQR